MNRSARFLLGAHLSVGIVIGSTAAPVMAEIIDTGSALHAEAPRSPRGRIDEALGRAEVRDQLARLGVSPNEIERRLDRLSAGEVAALASSIEDARAGGDGLGTVVTAILIVFLVLLATDILGFTKVFPFTRSVR